VQLDAVFKAYDIRGRTDIGELDAALAHDVGAAFARMVGSRTIAVGQDCRASSPALAESLVAGILDQGVDVIRLGEVATDTVYYYSGAGQVPGVMITASHNPPEYNGIKLCRAGAAPVGADTGLGEMKSMIEAGIEPGPGGGAVSSLDPTPGYVDHLFSVVSADAIAPLRVAVDGGNGMAGVVLERVFDRLQAELVGLYLEPDGTFPNHPADPIQPENLRDLIALVEGGGFDLGVAFDGDADRAFFVDDLGVPLSGSTTTALVARWFLDREPGATIVHNLITSRAVPETIRAHGGTPVRTRVGHSFIKQVMAETGAVFGGEHSGHYYFRANYRADSGMLAMLVLLQVLSEAGIPLSELRREVEPYAASGEVNLAVADHSAAIERVAEAFAGAELDRLDGLTVSFPDRWFNLRPSNTEPLVRLNVEGPDREAVEELVGRVRAIVESS
jgi:phosphomannomutase